MSSLPKPLLTPEEYLDIERKAEAKSEYYRGRMYSMSGGSRYHSRIPVRLTAMLYDHLATRGCELYNSDLRVLVEQSGFYTYPDLSVACGEPRFTDDNVDTLTNPILLVEVLSPSTERHDCIFKREHYCTIPSLQEYLIVRQDWPFLELHRRQPDGRWAQFDIAGLDGRVHLESIDFTLLLADVYLGILPNAQ